MLSLLLGVSSCYLLFLAWCHFYILLDFLLAVDCIYSSVARGYMHVDAYVLGTRARTCVHAYCIRELQRKL